ncbi:MAG: hypothetical protein V3S46_09115 [Nitrospinota bacterium]
MMTLRLIVLSIFLLWAGSASADSVRKIRYTDSSGQAHIVESIREVPTEYRSSATVVLVRQKREEMKAEEPEEKPVPKRPTAAPAATKVEAGVTEVTAPEAATEDKTGKESAAERLAKIKEALIVTSRIEMAPLKGKQTIFNGRVKNQLDARLSNATITINVIDKQAKERAPIISPISGKSGSGIIEANETVDINITTNLPPGSIAGFSYRLNWSSQ